VTAKDLRNVAIVLALAAAVYALPGAGFAAGLVVWVLGVAFLGAMAWFAARMYREYQPQLFGLGDRMRALLYGSVGVAVLTVTATPRLWDTPGGTLAWFALVSGAIFGVYTVWRASQEY
jgi:hypothetical protein